MYDDVIDLRDFYASRLGQATRRIIGRRIQEFWPEAEGLSVLGLGFATPYLRNYRDDTGRTIALMPAAQGVMRWPPDGPNRVALADEDDLPLPDESVDRVLLVHALERTEQLRPMLREIWRVMSGSGRLLIIVPNRRGIWARLERTPFGAGSPYSPGQVSRLLRDNLFTPTRHSLALSLPPSNSRMMLRLAPAFEAFGQRWFPSFSGVILVEASKQLYAIPPLRRAPKRRGALLPVFPQIAPQRREEEDAEKPGPI
ncbi:class I SAM-dependent methyltransferase [Elstera cyanobacteriorum]|uniref:Methyltransferase type 11 n=1 Tax=Elstera cyanobacteriorum TaxID=2022747 RepID=A0A255XNS3_9PROT|nr:methyltransferase domain-containing protein [Elstera cyanobacteriorum]MCK6441313.1 class I SAM-dependent methyltransferase [Elstera cyanobacteriorum]OYQ18014.1 methyltransferase type 11 [Elstera cyanobacteriorum]GFZ84468.1 methyltransferase type 11 [Elstera cyanobacteriorum]